MVLAVVFGVASVASALAQDQPTQTDAERRDWRLTMLVQDGALVDVTDLTAAAATEAPEASEVPTASIAALTPEALSSAAPTTPAALVLGAPTLSIDDERRLSGWTGCNAWTATYQLDGDSVNLGPVAATRSACPEPAGTLEDAYLADLALVASWSIDSAAADADLELLTLADADGEPLLVFVPMPASPLLGSWRITAYRDASGAVVPSVVGAAPTATFDASGRVTGSTGCNVYGADYVVDGQALAIGLVAATTTACEEPLVSQEEAFLAALKSSAHAAMLSESTLLLTDAVGSTTLILESVAPPPSPSPSDEPSPTAMATPTAVPTPAATPTPAPTPVKVRVPDLRGESEADAITALNDIDLLVGDRKKRYNATLAVGVVIRSDPEAGTRVKEGSRVDLYMSKGPEPTATPKPKPTPKPTPRPTPKPTPSPPPSPPPSRRPRPPRSRHRTLAPF